MLVYQRVRHLEVQFQVVDGYRFDTPANMEGYFTMVMSTGFTINCLTGGVISSCLTRGAPKMGVPGTPDIPSYHSAW